MEKQLLINNKIINIIIANNFFQKLLGLMGKKNISYGIYFPNINSIHTFFMKESIDILVLDKNNYILEIKKLSKNKIFISKYKKTSIIELPYNTSDNLKIGDKLTFISK